VKVSPVIARLSQNNPALLATNRQFRELTTALCDATSATSSSGSQWPHGIQVVSLGEGLASKLPLGLKTIVVPEESANPGVGGFRVLHDSTHINICKPRSKDDVRYTEALQLVASVAAAAKAAQGHGDAGDAGDAGGELVDVGQE